MTTYWNLMEAAVKRRPSEPIFTYYDLRPGLETSGERVELSALTYANWVAKTANLLSLEYDVEASDLITVQLPTHWLTPIWLAAAWTLGATVTDTPDPRARVAVVGPDDVESASAAQVVACSLRPMGTRFATPLPAGVEDFGAVVWSQPDALVALPNLDPTVLAWQRDGDELTINDLTDGVPARSAARVLSSATPTSRSGLADVVGPLRDGGGTVWVVGGDDAARQRISAEEHAVLLGEDRA